MGTMMQKIRSDDRGQTTTGFLFAITLFIALVGTVVLAIPSLTGSVASIQQPGDSGSPMAERVADDLTRSELTDGNPFVLNRTLAIEYFTAQSSPAAQAGVPDTRLFVEVVHSNGTAVSVEGELLQSGPEPRGDGISTSRQVVSIDGQQYELRVSAF